MVKVVDGYTEKQEDLKQHRTLVDLARKYFKGEVYSVMYDGFAPITVRGGNTGCDVEIRSHFVDVNKSSYLESAMKFAEEAEKIMGIEFVVKTTYQL